jgi:hypothetical protein
MHRRSFLAAAGALSLGAALTACGGSGSGSGGSTPAKPVGQSDVDKAMSTPTKLTFWTWVPNIADEVALFEKKYPAIKVQVVNAGQGADQYKKLRTALQAGTGAPDVCQIEYQYTPTFTITDSLLNLRPYGAAALQSKFVDWTWAQVSGPGGEVWAIPQDTHDDTLDWLLAYADAGGHLVLGPRTGYADHEGRARQEPAPGRLADAAGVSYTEFSNLTAPLAVRTVPDGPLPLPPGATATLWADALTVTGAQPLAVYEHPHHGRWPAVTTRPYGRGRITCVGTVPGRGLARALADWLAPVPRSGWHDLPGTVTVTTGTAGDGRRVHIVHNWSWESVDVRPPYPMSDVLTGAAVPRDQDLRLGAWDVRILLVSGD